MIGRAALPAIAAALALSGCTATAGGGDGGAADAAELADALAGRTAGEPRACLSSSRIESPRIIGQTLVYREGSRLWTTEPVDGCPSLRGDPILVVEVYGGQLCRNDRFRTVDRGASIPGPYCRFGDFTPYSTRD